MSIAKIQKSIFNGEVTVPASKSVAHRALICSFLAGGGNVEPIISSNDMAATVGIINSLKKGENTLNSIESGSTLRFMIPVAAALGKEVTFVGQGSLLSRPIGEYLTLLPLHGTQIKSNGYLPATISGKLRNGSFEVNGNVSSQYITGLLLALAALDGDSAVILKTELQSKPNVDMTITALTFVKRISDILLRAVKSLKFRIILLRAIGRRQHFSLLAVQSTEMLPLKGLI